MKIIVAPDSFKGSLTALEVAEAIEAGIKGFDKNVEVIKIPLSDGGEGTVDALVEATNGFYVFKTVIDPLERPIQAKYGVLGDNYTCVIEVASASGLTLLNEEEKNPLKTTSYGTGQLIKDALEKGYRKFIIGLGGSATNDGGVGLLQALGVKLIDNNNSDIKFGGQYLKEIERIDLTGMDSRLKDSEFIIANDVNNPLVGEYGATKVYGPQKGVTIEMVNILENGLKNFADLVKDNLNISIHNLEGAGAAGGIGGAFAAFFNSKFINGIELMIEKSQLKKHLTDTSLIITGEGKLDFQTSYGKVPFGVAKLAKNYNIPVIAIAGAVDSDINYQKELGLNSVYSIANKPMNIDEAIKKTSHLISFTTEQIIRTFKLSSS